MCFFPADRHNDFGVSTSIQGQSELGAEDLAAFHSHMKDAYIQALCVAGRAYQESLAGPDAHFKWESPELLEIHDDEESEMLRKLQPVPSPKHNIFDPATFSDSLPENPTILPQGGETSICERCNTTTDCLCITKSFDLQIRIKHYGKKNLGLQAVNIHNEALVFVPRQILGYFTGKLMPYTKPANDWCVNLNRLCKVDVSQMGSKFRLMNHACSEHATVSLVPCYVSGHQVLAVVARQRIMSGAEITMDYGHGTTLPCSSCEPSV